MSHNLATINGKTAMFAAIQDAWHKLGQRVQDCVTWEEAMKLAQLDWEVVKEQLTDQRGNQVEAWGTFRQAENPIFLGPVGNGYTPIQNREAFAFVDYVIGAMDGAHYETAGALGNGERVWCLARIPKEIGIKGTDDRSKPYIFFATAHDGSMSATSALTATRVVCQNTLNIALAKGSDSFMRVRHTKDAGKRLADGRLFLAAQVRKLEQFEETLNELAARRMTRETYDDVMAELFPKNEDADSQTRRNNQLREVANLYRSNDRNAFPEVAGTAYNLLNAVTEWTDHVRSVRGGGASLSGQERARAEAAVFGGGAKLKSEALEVIIEKTATNPRQVIAQPVSIVKPEFVTYQEPPTGSLLDEILAATPE